MTDPPRPDPFPVTRLDSDAGALFVLQSKGEWWHAGFHLTTAIVGPTILTLPYAFRGLGWWLGFVCLTTMGLVTFYAYYLMSKVLDHCEKSGRRHIRFRELAADVLATFEIGDRDSADVDETTPNTEADAHTEGDAVVHVVPLQLEDLEEEIQAMDLQNSPQNAPVAHGASSSSLAIQPSEVVPVAHGASASSLTIQPSEDVPLRTKYGRVVIPPSRLEQSGKKPIKKKNNRKK